MVHGPAPVAPRLPAGPAAFPGRQEAAEGSAPPPPRGALLGPGVGKEGAARGGAEGGRERREVLWGWGDSLAGRLLVTSGGNFEVSSLPESRVIRLQC